MKVNYVVYYLVSAVLGIRIPGTNDFEPWNSLTTILQLATSILGSYYHATSKGRSRITALWGLLPIVGWIVIAFLPNKNAPSPPQDA